MHSYVASHDPLACSCDPRAYSRNPINLYALKIINFNNEFYYQNVHTKYWHVA